MTNPSTSSLFLALFLLLIANCSFAQFDCDRDDFFCGNSDWEGFYSLSDNGTTPIDTYCGNDVVNPFWITYPSKFYSANYLKLV